MDHFLPYYADMNTNENQKLNILPDLILLAVLAGFAFWVNRDIRIKGLYMDDLYMWSCYGEQSVWEFAFPIGTSTRFRPVYWLATYLQMMIVGTHITRFVAFNIVCNIVVAWTLFWIARRLAGCRWVGLGVGICYLASRFAYYQIGQALGLMETMALLMAIVILFLLYLFIEAGWNAGIQGMPDAVGRAGDSLRQRDLRSRRRGADGGAFPFLSAVLIWFLLAFTHERYISLFPLFYYALIVRMLQQSKGMRIRNVKDRMVLWAAPAVTLALIILIRSFAIGKALPAGTGGTEVTDTFHISECIRYCVSQVLYIFGVNDGPEHLNGLPWEQTPPMVKRMTKFSVLMIGLICIAFLLKVLHELFTGKRTEAARHFAASLLFGGFIALCIGCSSVTIRVEMRWIYVSYAAALLYAAYMIGEISGEEGLSAKRAAVTALFAAYMVLSVSCNLFYRGYFPKLYFWPNQLRMNSLAEQTVEKYGTEGVFGKDIYILENTYEMSDFYARTFFKTYDPEKKAEGTTVYFVNDMSEIPAADVRSQKALVLMEVPEENAYKDITAEFPL